MKRHGFALGAHKERSGVVAREQEIRKKGGVCIGSAQRKGWGCSAKTRGYKKSWGSDWRHTKRVMGLRRENKRKGEMVRVYAGGKQRNG